MKKCPFCAENIQENVPRCIHCGAPSGASPLYLEEEKTPWYFRKSLILFAFFSVGPLALPLIWWRPHTSLAWKIGLTTGILALSWLLFQASMESMHMIEEYFKLLQGP